MPTSPVVIESSTPPAPTQTSPAIHRIREARDQRTAEFAAADEARRVAREQASARFADALRAELETGETNVSEVGRELGLSRVTLHSILRTHKATAS